MYIPGEVLFVFIVTCVWGGYSISNTIRKWKSGSGCYKCKCGDK